MIMKLIHIAEDTDNTLNIKLFPKYPSPPPIYPWQVPLFTVKIKNLIDESWDLTIVKIIPFVNGINPVARIASLADVALPLTISALQHLHYYNTLLLLDIFSFGAIYAPTAQWMALAASAAMQTECARYINTAYASSAGPDERNRRDLGGVELLELYTSLDRRLNVKDWFLELSQKKPAIAQGIDVRRLVTFGVIKGVLYRVHKYAIRLGPPLERRTTAASEPSPSTTNALSSTPTQKTLNIPTRSSKPHRQERPRGRVEVATSTSASEQSTSDEDDDDEGEEEEETYIADEVLERYLDGQHCFDQIQIELGVTDALLMDRLRVRGNVNVLYR